MVAAALFAVTGYIACRKMDSLRKEEPQQSFKETRFFNEHTSTNPHVQAIVGYLQRLNEKKGFADKTIERVGYPRWNKAIIVDKKANTMIESEDSVIITHIPFVRDSQNYVNASLVVRTTPNDTVLNYICDWQYTQMPYGAPNTDSSAENYAKYFMFFSMRTTGQSAFLITDTFLFSSSPRMYSTDRLKLTILDNNATAGLPETHSVLICYPVLHCGSPNSNACKNGCDYYSSAGCAQPGTCHIFYECVPFYYGGNGGGSGSGSGPIGGDPGSGGGGGSSSGVPPPCGGTVTPSSNFIEINEPCTPGWEPVPIEPEEPTVPDPCNKAKAIVTDTANANYMQKVKNLADSQNLNLNYEKTAALIEGTPPTVTEGSRTANNASAQIPDILGQKYLSFSHTHPNVSTGTYSVFSFGDLRRMSMLLHNGQLEAGKFVAFLSTYKGTYYALTISDMTKFADFFYYFNNEGNAAQGNIMKWLESHTKAKRIGDKYFNDPLSPLIKETDTDNNNVLNMFLDFMNEADLGVTLFETNANFNTFTRVEKQPNGPITRTPCN